MAQKDSFGRKFGKGFRATFAPTASETSARILPSILAKNLSRIGPDVARRFGLGPEAAGMTMDELKTFLAQQQLQSEGTAAPPELKRRLLTAQTERAEQEAAYTPQQRAKDRLAFTVEARKLSPGAQTYLEGILSLPVGSLGGVKSSEAAAIGGAAKLPKETATTIGGINSGLRKIQEVRSILAAPGGEAKKFKAGGVGAGLFSLKDPQAQKLRKAAGEVADVLTRARTGAALNEREQEYYGNLILSRWDTPEATAAGLKTYEDLFMETKQLLDSGRTPVMSNKADFLAELESNIRKPTTDSRPPGQGPQSGLSTIDAELRRRGVK